MAHNPTRENKIYEGKPNINSRPMNYIGLVIYSEVFSGSWSVKHIWEGSKHKELTTIGTESLTLGNHKLWTR